MNVVISYASNDENHANRIAIELEKSRINPWIDKKCIEPSTIWMKEIDKALTKADYVLGIITNNYMDSTGGLEGYATITSDRKKRKKKFVPLFFQDPDTLNSTIIPALDGIQFYASYDQGFKDLLNFLTQETTQQATEIISRIESPDYGNPFYRVRTELYGNDYKLIAKAFAQPETTLYELVQGNSPVYLFGGRGVGKTMLLKSLTPDVICSRFDVKSFKDANAKGVKFFGFYFRLKRGSLIYYNYGPLIEMAFQKTGVKYDYELYKLLIYKANSEIFEDSIKDPLLSAAFEICRVITTNELNYKLLQTVLQNIQHHSRNGLLKLDASQEHQMSEGISKVFDPRGNFSASSFDDLLDRIALELKEIEDYVQTQALPLGRTVNINWTLTGIDFLDDCLYIIKKSILDFHNVTFYFLFDEYENLLPVQQTIINEWVKTAKNFIVKVSSKFKGMYTHLTLQGQPIQFGQDCPEIILDYNLFDDTKFANYQKLLQEICDKLLHIAGYSCTEIKDLLEDTNNSELPQDVIDVEIESIRNKGNLKFDPKKISNYREKLQEAAIFRLLRKREKVRGLTTRDKRYCGFNTFTYLSSGIIRIFLNLVGAALYRAEEEKVDVKAGQNIPIRCQTWSANIVSSAWLDRIRTVYDLHEHGEKTHQLVFDLGDIFRERLLHHHSEPETITISITDPLDLRSKKCKVLLQILNDGTKESVFYERKESMKPKTSLAAETKEFVLNRVYAPVLFISYRPRWARAASFTTNDLLKLLNDKKRPEAKRSLLKEQLPKTKAIRHPTFDYLEAK